VGVSYLAAMGQRPAGTRISSSLISDPWLSERLCVPAFTLPDAGEPALEPGLQPAFIQTKVDIAALRRVEDLVRIGYMLVETGIVLARALGNAPLPPKAIRFAEARDEPAVRQIAGLAFHCSRFHADPLIANEVANRIKADWAGNFFQGSRGTHMVVAEEGGRVAGFLLLIAKGSDLVIDLVGVAPGAQGRGFGRRMIDFAAAHIREPRRFVVGTQLCNTRSLTYYAKSGFLIESARHSLHRHIGEAPAG
jgi:GNAT superfamily N-acetyltransferase